MRRGCAIEFLKLYRDCDLISASTNSLYIENLNSVGYLFRSHRGILKKTEKMNQDIILTTGIYDLIKDLLRRKKVTPFVEDQLIVQLKTQMNT